MRGRDANHSRAVLAILVGAVLSGVVATAQAAERTVDLAGCITAHTDTTVTLQTSGDEVLTIDTPWLEPAVLDPLLDDCVTVRAQLIDGRIVAESIEAGDEPNDVHSVTKETTADRERRSKQREAQDKKEDKHD